MPVALAAWAPDHIAGADLGARPAFALRPPHAKEDDESLASRMEVPVGAGARLKSHDCAAGPAFAVRLERAVDAYRSSEVRRRCFDGWSGAIRKTFIGGSSSSLDDLARPGKTTVMAAPRFRKNVGVALSAWKWCPLLTAMRPIHGGCKSYLNGAIGLRRQAPLQWRSSWLRDPSCSSGITRYLTSGARDIMRSRHLRLQIDSGPPT